MSPLSVRRYRAERLLRRDFEALRTRVLTTVRSKLSAGGGVTLDTSDLEACYAQAWHGLYAAVLAGEEIVNPAGWLVLVSFRRAIDEQRARGRAHRDGEHMPMAAGGESIAEAALETRGVQARDLAEELDDRVRLRQLFEGLRGRLSEREREAAVLCYLQGLSRAQAATRMGVSEARMRKLMEGTGAGRPGVAGKVGELVASIRDGEWCEEQGSLMRALAYGILDPDGERYKLAISHCSECPACRAYVASLRGLAAALPPVFLPWGLSAAALARAARGAHAGGASAVGGSGAAGSTGAGAGSGAQVGGGLGSTLSASGAASAGAGSGWLLTGGSLTAKLAAGCVLAFSVGAGCVALNVGIVHLRQNDHPRHPARVTSARGSRRAQAPRYAVLAPAAIATKRQPGPARPHVSVNAAVLKPADRASREFGPEQELAAGETHPVSASATTGRAASTRATRTGAGGELMAVQAAASSGGKSRPGSSTDTTGNAQAEREFAPG
jgi:RNA polymerase sigma factor (sigma-70 family)